MKVFTERMEESIRHEGIVVATQGNQVTVEIVQTSACSACKARSMCMSSESKEKRIDAVMLEPLKNGDRVEVMVTERLAWKAILLAYVMPFVVMMIVIAVLEQWLHNEVVVGSISLAAIAVYYLILSCFRNRLQKQFSFTAHKLD